MLPGTFRYQAADLFYFAFFYCLAHTGSADCFSLLLFSREEVIDLFRQTQDFINAQYAGQGQTDPENEKEREQLCQRALAILLYGVVDAERKGL